MASSSTQRGATTNKSILTPDMTLDGHEPYIVFPPDGGHHEYKSISCISYFPDGKQMISGSPDKTIRRWDLQKGKEIGDAREVCEYRMKAVGVSRDGRWIVTAGFEVKVSEVETGIVRIFHKGKLITWIDISADSKLVVGGSINHEGWIWRLDTGELVAGPFKFGDGLTFTVDIALRFRLSEDSRKLAVLSLGGRCFEVWDVQTQKLDVQQSTPSIPRSSESAPVLWTTKHKSIVTVFNSTSSDLFHTTIYEFDASTFKTVGAPFKGHTYSIEGLALSSDCVLLVSSCYDTIKLWAFESRQLLASFDMESPAIILILSPDSRQLAYTNRNDSNIYICNIPVNILVSIGLAEEPQSSTNKPERSRRAGLLDSDATRPVRRKPVIIPVMSPMPRPLPTSDQHSFLRFLRNISSSSPGTGVVCTDEPRNPLDFPATSPLPRPLIKHDKNSRPLTTQSSVVDTSPTFKSSSHRLSTWWPFHTSPAIVHVPHAPGKLRYATAGAPRNDDDDLIRDEDYVSPPPSPDPGSRRVIANTGQHGRSRFCFCF